MKSIIFYFSGTGNSYAIAKEIADGLEDTEIQSVLNIGTIEVNAYQRVGFVIPVYTIHAPEIVLHLIENIHFLQSQQIFIIANYAASRGYAITDMRDVIAHNYRNPIQEFCVRMPGNYILMYSAFPQAIQNFMLKHAKKKVHTIVRSIKNKERSKKINPNLLAFLFKNNGLKMSSKFTQIGKLFYADDQCQHCGICTNICPTENIINMDGNITWGDKCSQCMACIQWCPYNAVKHPNLKKNRIRYHHPDVKLPTLLQKTSKFI